MSKHYLTLSSLVPSYVPYHHADMPFKHLQGWALHHLPQKLFPVSDDVQQLITSISTSKTNNPLKKQPVYKNQLRCQAQPSLGLHKALSRHSGLDTWLYLEFKWRRQRDVVMKGKLFHASTFLSSPHKEQISHKELQPPSSYFWHYLKQTARFIISQNRKILIFKTYAFFTYQGEKEDFFHWPWRCTTALPKIIKAGH